MNIGEKVIIALVAILFGVLFIVLLDVADKEQKQLRDLEIRVVKLETRMESYHGQPTQW